MRFVTSYAYIDMQSKSSLPFSHETTRLCVSSALALVEQ